MSVKTLITSLIVVVAVAGAAVVGWLLWVSKHTTTEPIISNTTSGGGANTTNVSNSSSQASSLEPAAAPDILKAYAGLFASLLASPISFNQATSSSGTRAAITALYAKDIEENKKITGQIASVDMAIEDLNNDGIDEVLVYENLPIACGTAGCPLEIYQNIQNKWTLLYSIMTGEYVGLSNTLTNGYLDLFLSTQGGIGFQSQVVRYVWKDGAYQPGEIVATWNGSAFLKL